MLRRKPLSALSVLIFLMNVLRACSIRCSPSEYPAGYICCSKCPPGSQILRHCTESEGTQCVACTEGTFMDQESDRGHCSTCRKCDAASGLRIKTPCSRTSDSVCEPLEGFFCTQSTEDGCGAAQRHTHCDPGHYISQNGSPVSDTKCSLCSIGSFSDGSFTSCQSHTKCDPSTQKLTAAGTQSQDAKCGERDQSWMEAVVCGVFFWLFYLIVPPLMFAKIQGIRFS